MPDVGVLQLKISADASSASRSLSNLQSKLEALGGVAGSVNLSNVATQIGNIVKQVSGNKDVTAAVKNLGTLLNAITQFSKLTKIGLTQTQIKQISSLQSAVSGFNLGQAGTQLNKLREALGGEWNLEQAEKVGQALKTIAQGTKTMSDSGATETIKNASKAVESMTSGTSGELKAMSTEMKTVGQEAGRTAQTLERIDMIRGNGSLFGRMPAPFMSMQGSVLNETAGFAESTSQIKEVSVVAKEAITGMQELENAVEETSDAINGIDISGMAQEVEQAASYMNLADKDIASEIDNANNSLEKQIQLRQEALEAENQARLEKNYESYRELYLSKEGDWQKQVPEMYGFTPKAIEEGETYAEAFKITMQEVNEYVDDFINKMNTPSGTLLRDSIDGMLGIGNAAKSAEESSLTLQNAPEVKTSVQEVQTAVNGMSNSMSKSQTTTRVLGEDLKDLDKELKEKKSDLNNVKDATESTNSRFSELMLGCEGTSGALKRMFPTLSGLANRFKQLVKYRMLRTIIKQISEGFQEGTENYYYYSTAIGGTFASSMDAAATSLQTFKNSIGAAVAPIASSLIPVLQSVVSWVTSAINLLNQFFALLNGQSTWSKATDSATTAFKDLTSSAGGASDAVNDLLADWDELNIIQSDSSGGGGGGSGASLGDYETMFEEIGEFDETIQEIVNFIKDNFDDILTIVEQIGAALLLWKFSNAFSGLIGTLSGLVAAGLVGAIVFEISTLFTNKYLETGDIGWLIADLITTMIGAYWMRKILGTVLNGEYAYLAIPITLSLDAAARIIATIGHTDVDALSTESLISNIVSALEIGGVAGYLAYTAGATTGQALAGGAVATILTFSALIGLKADVNAIKNGEITEDTIIAKALSSLGLSIGAAAAAKLLIPEISMAQAAGFGAATGGALTLVTMSATLGIVATTKAIESGITEEVILQDLLSSLSMAVGSTLIIKMITANSWLASSAGGAGVGVATLGALIGIQATCEVAENGEITFETIKNDAIASLLTGGGVALVAGTLVGAGAGAAMTIGGLAALVTFGALIGIQAIIALSDEKDNVQWGDYNATEAEIRAFIDEQVFSGSPMAKISLANAKVEELGENKSKLEAAASDVLGTLYSVRLGLISGAESDLRSKVEAFVSSFNATSTNYQEALQISVSLIPVSSTDDGGESIAKNSQSRWAELNGIMTTLANDLTNEFDKTYSDNVDEVTKKCAEESIEKISNMMARIADAVATGQAQAKVANNINTQINNLTQESMSDMLDYYEEQRDALIEEMLTLSSNAAEGVLAQYYAYEKLAEYALEDAKGNTEDATYKHYKEQASSAKTEYEQFLATNQKDIENAADKILGDTEGAKQIKNALLSQITESLPENIEDVLSMGNIDASTYSNYLSNVLTAIVSGGDESSELKARLTENLSNSLYSILSDFLGTENVEEYYQAIENGIIGYADVFGSDFKTRIREALNISSLAPELQEIWDEIINELIPTDPVEVPLEIDAKPEVTSGTNWWSSLSDLYESTMAKISSTFNFNANANGEIAPVVVNVEQDNEQDVSNVAEGTKQGVSGLATQLGVLTGQLSTLNGYASTIAANSGNSGGVSGSQAGYLITNALNQFGVVSNSVR